MTRETTSVHIETGFLEQTDSATDSRDTWYRHVQITSSNHLNNIRELIINLDVPLLLFSSQEMLKIAGREEPVRLVSLLCLDFYQDCGILLMLWCSVSGANWVSIEASGRLEERKGKGRCSWSSFYSSFHLLYQCLSDRQWNWIDCASRHHRRK